MNLRFGGWNRFSGFTVAALRSFEDAKLENGADRKYPPRGINYSVSPEGVELRFKLPDVIMNGNYRAELHLDKSDLQFLRQITEEKFCTDANLSEAVEVQKADSAPSTQLMSSIIDSLQKAYGTSTVIKAVVGDEMETIEILLKEKFDDLNADAMMQIMRRFPPRS